MYAALNNIFLQFFLVFRQERFMTTTTTTTTTATIEKWTLPSFALLRKLAGPLALYLVFFDLTFNVWF